jgi:hypothetical protein
VFEISKQGFSAFDAARRGRIERRTKQTGKRGGL